MKFILIILFSFQIINVKDTYSQGCCTAGSSTFGGLERGIAWKKNLNVSLSFLHNSLKSTYDGENEIADPLGRTASVSIFNFELEYGLAEDVSLLVVSGYSIRSRETVIRSSVDNMSEKINFKGSGLTDITMLAKYQLIAPSILSALSLTIGGGVKLPIGSYDLRENGTRLSIDLQPGTGATDVLMWGNFYKGFQPLSLSVFANILYRYPGINLDGYKFGDEYLISLMAEYYFTDYLTFSLGIRGRYAEDDFWGGRFLPSTGGTYFDFIPGLIYSENFYSIKLFYQSPVNRNVRGIQLTTSSIIGTEILFNLNL
jgi:hypothetical protein